jgi:O-antigen ligase
VTIGRICMAAALLAVIWELRDPRALLELGRAAFRGPGRLLLIGGGVCLAAVLVSSHTNGCNCNGGLHGLIELSLWTILILLVVLEEPSCALLLLGALVFGGVVAGILALAHVDAAGTVRNGSTRLVGPYGNPNFLAAAEALAAPAAVYAARSWRGRRRLVALLSVVLLGLVIILTYSRAGLVAAALGAYVTAVLVVVPRWRTIAAVAIASLAVALSLALYPVYARERNRADFNGEITAARSLDASGWYAGSTGLIGDGPSKLSNDGPTILEVMAARPGEGASLSVGQAQPSVTYRLRFDARARVSARLLNYGLEDNVIEAGPVHYQAYLTTRWSSFELGWRPSALARAAGAYFWASSIGTFELRRLTWSTLGSTRARALPIRLRGPVKGLDRRIKRTEAAYIKARKSAFRIAFDAFIAHPLEGIGWERFPSYASSRSGVGAIATHDEYVRFAAELGTAGLLGLAALCGACIWAAIAIRAHRLAPALFGVLVSGAVGLAFANLLEVPDASLPIATAAASTIALATRGLTISGHDG